MEKFRPRSDITGYPAARAGISIDKDEVIAELLKLLPSVAGDDFIIVLSLNKKGVITGKVTHRESHLFNELFEESFSAIKSSAIRA